MKMFGFAGWNFIGTAAGILRGQGINILLNLFFSPAVNAAQGIAVQVNNAITNFSNNFLVAINPQIIKSYSQNDLERAYDLVLYASRFAFLLLLVLSAPIICETDVILQLWLKNVPDYASTFARLSLLLAICDALSLPLVTLQQATGKIRNYQLIVGSIHMLNFPLSLLLLYIGSVPNIVYFVAIFLSIVSLYARLIMQNRQLGISIMKFHTKVLSRASAVAVLCILSILMLQRSSINQYFNMVLSFVFTVVFTIMIGFTREEIVFVLSKIRKRL